MSDMNENIEEFEEDNGNYITLTDDDGNEVSFEFLDLIEYKSHEYVVLLPFDDESDEVVILEIKETEDSELEEYLSVDDEEILNTVFEIFKEKFKDEFNFE